MLTSFDFEELLQPVYAKVTGYGETSDEIYNKTNADVLNTGENLVNAIYEMIAIQKSQTLNPDFFDVDKTLMNLLEETRGFDNGLPGEKLLLELYKSLGEYLHKFD